ncbi:MULTISPECIES: hypothetical protein [Microbacterium]|uniref:hypothetical protein n=1 Tax=Microbacterium TaxID=33882 RepID=UPI00146A1F7B|nr:MULTISPECIES: hypothetical protein [Microbacterium]
MSGTSNEGVKRHGSERKKWLPHTDAQRERRRLTNQAWRARNRDHVRAEGRRWREENLEKARELNRLSMQRQSRKHKREVARRERKRTYARKYYANNRDRILAQHKAARVRSQAADPDRYREMAYARTVRWRDSHRDALNQTQRDRRRANPQAAAESSRRYYEKNREQVLQRKRERYAENHELARAKSNAYYAREARRRTAGLPPRRLHRASPADRVANGVAADEFFSRTYTGQALNEMLLGSKQPTPPELLAAWKRDCLRARAAHHQATTEPATPPSAHDELRIARLAAKAAEDARLDAIGRAVNARLRTERARAALLPDPAAPHHAGSTPNGPHITR